MRRAARSNYGKAKTLVGADLVGTPDLALNPAIAGKILFTRDGDGPLHHQEVWRLFQQDGRGLAQRSQDHQRTRLCAADCRLRQRFYGAISYTTA
jgi:hypothetical protein